jgi:hypothetical protein
MAKPAAWISIASAVSTIQSELSLSEGAAQERLIEACASGVVQSCHRETGARQSKGWWKREELDLNGFYVRHYIVICHDDFAAWLRTDPASAMRTTGKTPTRRSGPARGAIDRYGDADRKLFPKMRALMRKQHCSPGEAARLLAQHIAGTGTEDSRVRRLAERFKQDKLQLGATHSN